VIPVKHERATHFRLRRLEASTGYFRSFEFPLEGGGTVVDLDVSLFSQDLLARLPPGTWRVVWLAWDPKRSRNLPLAKSAAFKVEPAATEQSGAPSASADARGGVTPPAYVHPEVKSDGGAPPGVPSAREVLPADLTIHQPPPQGGTIPPKADSGGARVEAPTLPVQGGGRLETGETLAFLRGLAWVIQQVTDPIVRGVQEDASARLARDRAYFDAMISRERELHAAQLERDRQFSAAIQAHYAKPQESALAALEQRLTARIDAALDAETSSGDDAVEPEAKADNAWTVAGKALESAPDIIKTIADVARSSGVVDVKPSDG